jgi:hypothetical protein
MENTNNNTTINAARTDFFKIERESAGDFPFYNGIPQSLTGLQWLVILFGVAAGFYALTAPVEFYMTTIGGFLSVVLFFAVPLFALAIVAGSNWTALFRKLQLNDILVMFAVALLNIIVTVAVALALRHLFDMSANPVGDMLREFSGGETMLFFIKTIPQLFGEEVVTILPFLAVLWFCFAKLNMPRKRAVIIAWLSAAVIFGALHLPTYEWNFVQCFVVIGTARIVLLLGYIITKNILVSTGAHIINDWVIFLVMIAGGSAAAA